MRGWIVITALMILAAAAACGPREPACPNSLDPGRFLSDEEFERALEAPPPPAASPVEVEIGRQKIMVDKVVSGPLCNDSWRGTVYVTCDARVAAWSDEEAPEFLKGCKLDVEPGTVVYVQAHYDTPYYEGCSCHTGEIGGP